jgi:hypothetical protein
MSCCWSAGAASCHPARVSQAGLGRRPRDKHSRKPGIFYDVIDAIGAAQDRASIAVAWTGRIGVWEIRHELQILRQTNFRARPSR